MLLGVSKDPQESWEFPGGIQVLSQMLLLRFLVFFTLRASLGKSVKYNFFYARGEGVNFLQAPISFPQAPSYFKHSQKDVEGGVPAKKM